MQQTIATAIASFLHHKTATGRSSSTIKQYESILTNFATTFGGFLVQELAADEIDEYFCALRSRKTRYTETKWRKELKGGVSEATINDHTRILKVFFRWAYRRYKLNMSDNPLAEYKAGGSVGKDIKFISDEDRDKILEVLNENNDLELRNKAIIAILADSGCRVGALVTMHIEDVGFEYDNQGCVINAQVRVIEKGSQRKTIYLSRYAATILKKWLATRHKYTSSTFVFCSFSPKTSTDARLEAGGINQLLEGVAKKANVKGPYNPHAFRHAFARNYLKNGGDLASLSQIMGHKSIAVTAMYYARFLPHELQEMHANNSPLTRR